MNSTAAEKFNYSKFGRWINSGRGRAFRLIAGICFLVTGLIFIHHPLGIASLIWSFFPLTAGLLNVCYISLVLGGPFKGSKIKELQKSK
jgi:hypothetical protein